MGQRSSRQQQWQQHTNTSHISIVDQVSSYFSVFESSACLSLFPVSLSFSLRCCLCVFFFPQSGKSKCPNSRSRLAPWRTSSLEALEGFASSSPDTHSTPLKWLLHFYAPCYVTKQPSECIRGDTAHSRTRTRTKGICQIFVPGQSYNSVLYSESSGCCSPLTHIQSVLWLSSLLQLWPLAHTQIHTLISPECTCSNWLNRARMTSQPDERSFLRNWKLQIRKVNKFFIIFIFKVYNVSHSVHIMVLFYFIQTVLDTWEQSNKLWTQHNSIITL